MTEPMERCISCTGIILDADDVYADRDGGYIHARCCGLDRASYTNVDGRMLGELDEIPKPWKWGSR